MGVFGIFGLLILIIVLLPASGWWLAVRLRLDGVSRLTAACLGGTTTVAGAELFVYAVRLPQWVAALLVASAIAASAPGLVAAIRRREFAWDGLLTWAGLSTILSGVTVAYAVHGLQGSVFDWYEHWLRSLIFLEQGPVTTRIGIYVLPARGPLFNGAAALLLYLGGSAEYWAYQVIAIALNTLLCLPFALLLRSIGGLSRRLALLVSAAVCLLVPFFFWNNTFSWTKDLTAAFVLMGTFSYLAAYRKSDREGMAMALAWLAPGFLTHYLTLVYAGVLVAHLLAVTPWKWPLLRALARAVAVWAVVVGTWFSYMMWNFGVKRTFGSNTTIGRYQVAEDAEGREIPYSRVMVANLCTDVLPARICRPILPAAGSCLQVAVEGRSVTNMPGPCSVDSSWNGIYATLRYSGMFALILAAAVSAGSLLRKFGGEARFLLWFLAGGLVLNLVPIRWFDSGGSFSENLQAWSLVLFAVVACGLARLPRWAIVLLAAGLIVEFGSIDWRHIREQTVVLPLANERQSGEGAPPLGSLLPVPESGVRFVTDSDYYQNYLFKIRGGALFYRDLHPEGWTRACCILLVIGVLTITATFIFLSRGNSTT